MELQQTREMISKTKVQPMEWEKMFTHHTTNRGLISRFIKNFKNSTAATTNPIKKWAKEVSRDCAKDHIVVANSLRKKCSSSLVIREIQVTTSLWFHLMPVELELDPRLVRNLSATAGEEELGTFLACLLPQVIIPEIQE